METTANIHKTTLLYDTRERGYDQRFWRTTAGTPAWDVTTGYITFNQDTAYSFDRFKYGQFQFRFSNVPSPTGTTGQRFGFRNEALGDRGAIYFELDETTGADRILAHVGDSAGTLTSQIIEVDNATFWAAAHTFEIGVYPDKVVFVIDGQRRATIDGSLRGKVPANLYMSNADNTNLRLEWIQAWDMGDRECTHDAMPKVYDSQSLTTAGTESDTDLKAAGSSALFVNVPVARRVVIRTTIACSVKLNATTMPAISLAANTEYEWGNFGELAVHNIFLTTAAAGANTIKIELYP